MAVKFTTSLVRSRDLTMIQVIFKSKNRQRASSVNAHDQSLRCSQCENLLRASIEVFQVNRNTNVCNIERKVVE